MRVQASCCAPPSLPRIQERAPDRLQEEEVAQLVVLEEPWGFVMHLGLHTGLRRGELTRAKASDVAGGVLTVAQTKSGRVCRILLQRTLLIDVKRRVGLLVPTNY